MSYIRCVAGTALDSESEAPEVSSMCWGTHEENERPGTRCAHERGVCSSFASGASGEMVACVGFEESRGSGSGICAVAQTPSSLPTPVVLRIEMGGGNGQEGGAGNASRGPGLSCLVRDALDEPGVGAVGAITGRDEKEMLNVSAFVGSTNGSPKIFFLKPAVRQPATLSRPRRLGVAS